jgi:hypothetical protein
MADKKQFLNTKSIVKVETGIVTLISYRHHLKIGAAPISWMGPIRNLRWEQKRTEGYVIVST